jgi:exosortase sorting signal-containing protein
MKVRLFGFLLRVAGLLFLLCLLGTGAQAQTTCFPATIPCQTCPAPPPCTPSNTPCAPVGPTNVTTTTSFVSCTGSFDQNTITPLENTIGPANICIGPNKSVGCLVPAGTSNVNINTHTILFSAAVGVPTLSVWGFGLLVVTLGALALRRLRSRPI